MTQAVAGLVITVAVVVVVVWVAVVVGRMWVELRAYRARDPKSVDDVVRHHKRRGREGGR